MNIEQHLSQRNLVAQIWSYILLKLKESSACIALYSLQH